MALVTQKQGTMLCLHVSQAAAVSSQAHKNSQPSRLCSHSSISEASWKLARSGKIWVFGNSANGAALQGTLPAAWCSTASLANPTGVGRAAHEVPKHMHGGPSKGILLSPEMIGLLIDMKCNSLLVTAILLVYWKSEYKTEDISWFLEKGIVSSLNSNYHLQEALCM